ncbi:MAG: hypothetical protein K9M57_08610 [Phycisphaerae bacterium]|nr:hypothetical protein [Phycisphaerae bacterium]
MKNYIACLIVVIMAAPAFAVFTNDFETDPFNPNQGWSTTGNVFWTGERVGLNDYVSLGLSQSTESTLSKEFTAPVTGQYSVNFDYRFIGDISGGQDSFTVEIGVSNTPITIYSENQYTIRLDLPVNGENYGNWVTVQTPDPEINLDAGTSFLTFRLLSETGTTNTLLHIDNVNAGVFVVPAPGAVLLAGLGAGLVGWLRKRKTL